MGQQNWIWQMVMMAVPPRRQSLWFARLLVYTWKYIIYEICVYLWKNMWIWQEKFICVYFSIAKRVHKFENQVSYIEVQGNGRFCSLLHRNNKEGGIFDIKLKIYTVKVLFKNKAIFLISKVVRANIKWSVGYAVLQKNVTLPLWLQ